MLQNWWKWGAIAALVGSLGWCASAQALPGEPTEDVATWIEANPSFRGSQIGNLQVTRYNTAAQKFTFTASLYAPKSRASTPSSLVRSEEIFFFDVTNGVSFERLTEALRTIYGVNVYQDFASAREVFNYPDIETINRAKRENLPTLAAQQGKLLEGDRYAYWIEVIKTDIDSDFAHRGHVIVFLKEDLAALENSLGSR